jgi:hypothetical protein
VWSALKIAFALFVAFAMSVMAFVPIVVEEPHDGRTERLTNGTVLMLFAYGFGPTAIFALFLYVI